MSVRVMDMRRQKDLTGHIAAAATLPEAELNALARLATQLRGQKVLPVIGAGASWDCGMRLAAEISRDVHTAYLANPDYAPHDEGIDPADLSAVTEAIYVCTGEQSRVVHEVGLPDPKLWRPAETMGEHFCLNCVLGRMVREGFLGEAFSFNYDCGGEAGLTAEGFTCGDVVGGARWIDKARVVADAATNASTAMDQSSFTLYKANGCAVRYRELAVVDEEAAANEIVIRQEQLEEWKDSAWSRDPFRARAQNHILMLIGFSAQDTKFTTQVRQVLDHVYSARTADGQPRVVAIDRARTATQLETMIACGLGGTPAVEGAVTKICTEGSTATAALLVLLAEMLALELESKLAGAQLELPEELEARLATLIVAAPTMLQWSFLVRVPRGEELIQRANQMAGGGYVPLGIAPELTARAVNARRRLRARLGLAAEETSAEALASHGFLVDAAAGRAYMPVGIDSQELLESCREGAELEAVRVAMADRRPKNLDCILIGGDGRKLDGLNLETGRRFEGG